MKRDRALLDEILFPGGKTRAFTASYDDGTVHDRRLLEILNRHGIRGTFNLSAGFFGLHSIIPGAHGPLDVSKLDTDEVPAIYAGHEIAGHGLYHASPVNIGLPAFMYETIEDKARLEQVTGHLVRGYAYPFGLYDRDTKRLLRMAGYHYARAVETTGGFDLPADFMEWKGTCHHNDPRLMDLAREFCSEEGFAPRRKLFYLWGHSYEFAGDDNWDRMEELCGYLQEHGSDIWFATNIEICDYVNAFRSLEYGAEATMVYNPTALTLWLRRGQTVHTIAPLSTVRLD